MIWDVFNAVLHSVFVFLSGVLSVLPASPIFIDSATVTAISGITGYVAWFLPLTAMSATFGLFLVGMVGWIGYLLVKQLVEALLP